MTDTPTPATEPLRHLTPDMDPPPTEAELDAELVLASTIGVYEPDDAGLEHSVPPDLLELHGTIELANNTGGPA